MKAQAQAISKAFDVRHSGVDQPIRRLSGGNIQKFILGRELQQVPGLVVAHQPTWGLDVGAVAFIHEQLRQAARRGACVLLISEDLDEVLALGDRVAVMFRGRLSEFASASSWSMESLGLAMAGALAELQPEPA
jgi:simple sugar transport system ATP-binding protein